MTDTDMLTALPPMAPTTTDLDFLQGAFDVTDCRRRDADDPESGWIRSRATAIATTHFAGAISVDEAWSAAAAEYELSLRLFEPARRTWTAYRIPSRTGALSPVTGQWSETTGSSARWEEPGLADGGGATRPPIRTREFVRRVARPDHSAGPRVTSDFDFLTGTWRVRHHRLLDPLAEAGSEWVEFDGVLCGSIYANGAVSIDEVSLADAGHRGFTVRTYDPVAQEWSIYWVNSRSGRLEPPVRGRFADGVGTFTGTEELGGRPVQVRFVWSDISATTARWRQAFSFDGGATWADNWEMRFTREASA